MFYTHVIKSRAPKTQTAGGTGMTSDRWQPKRNGKDRKALQKDTNKQNVEIQRILRYKGTGYDSWRRMYDNAHSWSWDICIEGMTQHLVHSKDSRKRQWPLLLPWLFFWATQTFKSYTTICIMISIRRQRSKQCYKTF